ncbi:MAG: flagellar biosynthetic protein FliR [Actinobacteria bacterium]|nr:flagellar biosynthetic protein FliR [Actinomycetota bacterium]
MTNTFNFLNLVSNNILPFGMVVTRIFAIFFSIPVFNTRRIPNSIKIFFSLSFAVLIFPMLSININIMDLDYFEIFRFLASELIAGLIIGFIVTAVFSAIQMAGRIIDLNNGFGFSQIVDPVSNVSSTVTTNFFGIIATTLFFVTGSHGILIGAIARSYEMLPAGRFEFRPEVLEILLRSFGDILVIGFKIAAPVAASLVLTEVALAIMARVIPQIPIFIIGFPLKIMVSILILALTMINTVPYLKDLFNDSFVNIGYLLKFMRPRG